VTNPIALQFIRDHEGCELVAYPDATGIPTVGYGQTGPDIFIGTVWTQDQANAALEKTVAKVESDVRRLLGDTILSTEQMAAVISLTYNVGAGAFSSSTLLTLLKGKDWLAAAKQFERWDRAGGAELKGLLIRRFEEAVLFLKGS